LRKTCTSLLAGFLDMQTSNVCGLIDAAAAQARSRRGLLAGVCCQNSLVTWNSWLGSMLVRLLWDSLAGQASTCILQLGWDIGWALWIGGCR
jgi:hypothetical protein